MAADGYENKDDLVESLRGVERQTLELIAEVSTLDDWVQLLAVPLRRAVSRGNRDLAHKLIDAGAAFGDALHEAVEGGYEGIVNDLLEAGDDARTEDERGRTPLHCAASNGQTEMVQLLLLKGADKDALTADTREFPPLFLAIESNNVATARALLDAGVGVNTPQSSGRTALHMAAQTGHVEMLRAMLEYGPEVNAVDAVGYTALHVAAFCAPENDNSAAIDTLVEAGASIEARDKYDSTPLHGAAKALKPVAVAALLRHGADVNARGDAEDTPLHCAVAYTEAIRESAGVVDLLLRSGADVNAQDEDLDTPLHIVARQAVVQGAAELVDLLLKSGADVNAQDDYGDTPLHLIAHRAGIQGAAGLVDLLLRSGADEDITNINDNIAYMVAGIEVEEMDRVDEDFNGVERLLLNAPFDRAWRRRGYLVLCRAHPEKLPLGQERSSKHGDTARRTRSKSKAARTAAGGCGEETVGGDPVGGEAGDDWAAVVRKALGLQEEGIFRTIVGYL